MGKYLFILLATLLIVAPVRAEETAPAPTAGAKAADLPAPAPAPASAPAADAKTAEAKPAEASDGKKDDAKKEETTGGESSQRKTGIARLVKKLTDKNGKPIPIAILTPLDYTTLDFANLALETITSAISRYGTFDLKNISYSPPALTLEEFRKVVTHYNVDVVMLAVLKPTNFDMFLYDRRTPYFVYAHSEVLPEQVQYRLTKAVVEEYVKAIVRRTLYAYMQDQYYELPREEIHPLLSSEIPRWIASAQAYHVVNNEIVSNWTASLSVGAALESGTGGLWTSDLIGFQLNRRISDNLYLEGGLEMFALNTIMGGVRYLYSDRDSPYRITFGLSLAKAMNAHTISWDQHYTQGLGGSYVVPSASFDFPIIDVHFQVESQALVSLGGGKFIFTVMPGVLFMF